MTTRTAGGVDFTAIDGKRQGRKVPRSLRVAAWIRATACMAADLGNPIKRGNAHSDNKQNNTCKNKAGCDPGLQGLLKNASDIYYLRSEKD